ncbi:MAG: Dam family site-specific DNA-(adenine-N6)-methyltransferase [Pseudomonadota bacterium]
MSKVRRRDPREQSLQPFLRWAGGKRWLAKIVSPILKQLLQASGGTYIEPFLGAGAMFFGLSPQRAHLSDINAPLIQTYRTIAQSGHKVEERIASYTINANTYYALRKAQPIDPVEAAARFIFLNRTCYGGLYRENRAGQFNVPYGGGSRTPRGMLGDRLISRAQFALRGVELECCDFEKAIGHSKRGDIIYCDPTYSNVKRDAFDRYGANLFGWNDQERLAYLAENAMDRGVLVLISNGYFEELFNMYPAAYRICLDRKKTIGNRATSEYRHREYLMILDPNNRKDLWSNIGGVENRKRRARFATLYSRTKSFNYARGLAS